MARFTWVDEERRYKHSMHGKVISAMHGALACDIRPGGRGDKAAHTVAEIAWNEYRYTLESHRREVAELKAEIRRLQGSSNIKNRKQM